MDQDELLANVRELLYKKPGKPKWNKLQQLFLHWPEDTLPEVVADYIYTTAIEGLWKKYLPARGYKSIEDVHQAPSIERTMQRHLDTALDKLESDFEERKELLYENYEVKEGPKAIKSLRVERKNILDKLEQREWDQLRKAITSQKNEELEPLYFEGWMVVAFNDGDIQHSGGCDCTLNRKVESGQLHIDIEFDVEDGRQWAIHLFDPDWRENQEREFYEDDWE